MDDPPKVEKTKQENIIKMAKVNTTKNERQSVLWLSQETVDLVRFTEEILNENFIFCAVYGASFLMRCYIGLITDYTLFL